MRVATRIWWRSSGSEPSRVPGSWSGSSAPGARARAPARRTAGRRACLRLVGRDELERAEELRRAAPTMSAPAFRSSFSSLRSVSLVAADELDLELAEAVDDALADEDGDGVVDDLGAAREDDLAPRPQPRDRRRARGRAGTRRGATSARAAAAPAGRAARARSARHPWGSFSCQTPAPSSTRCRSVRPCRASTRSGVSW